MFTRFFTTSLKYPYEIRTQLIKSVQIYFSKTIRVVFRFLDFSSDRRVNSSIQYDTDPYLSKVFFVKLLLDQKSVLLKLFTLLYVIVYWNCLQIS